MPTPDVQAVLREIAELRALLAEVDRDGALARIDRQQLRDSFDRIELIVDGADNPLALRTEVPRAHQRLDAADRERRTLAELVNASKLKDATDALLRVLGFGDAAKRAWLLFAVAGVVLLAAAGYGAYAFFTDPAEREHERQMERDRLRREWVRDSLELEIDRAKSGALETLADDATDPLTPARDTVATVDADEVNVADGVGADPTSAE